MLLKAAGVILGAELPPSPVAVVAGGVADVPEGACAVGSGAPLGPRAG